MHARNLVALAVLASTLVTVAADVEAITLTGPTGKTWDIDDTGDGAVIYGTSYTFYDCYTLTVNGVHYNAGGTSTPIMGGRGVLMRQHYITSDLTVQRSAWVPETGAHDFLRYYDTFENGSSEAIDVTATYDGELGAWIDAAVAATSSGDTTVDTTDTWYSVYDPYGYYPPNGHVWYDTSALNPTSLALTSGYYPRTTFEFSVPPLSRVALTVFPVQMGTSIETSATCAWLAGTPAEAMEGLAAAEMMQIINWQAGGAPVIRLETEALEVEEGGTLGLSVAVEDLEGDTFDIGWDLDGDGDHDDGTSTSVVFDAAGLDGDTTAQVSVQAVDSESNERVLDISIEVLNAAPVFLSEPGGLVDGVLTLSRGQSWEYQIEVDDPANIDGTERDPVVVTVPQRPDGSIFFGDLRLQWNVPNEESVVGDHEVIIQADDREEGVAEQTFVIRVPANSPPDQPTILSPDRTVVSDPRPEFLVTNATDADGDDLIYQFQVNTAADFATATMVAAGNRMESPTGQTSWTITSDLEDGVRYYWRVWANDGRQDGPASSTYFDVDMSSTSEPDLDVSTDAETDVPSYTPPDESGGCGCHLVGNREGSGLPSALVLMLVMFSLALASRIR